MSSKPPKLPIGYIGIRVFAHATEDQERVIQALRNILPDDLAKSAVFKKTSLTGHHGNPITMVETEVAERQRLMAALAKIGERLTSLDRQTLNNEIEMHLEKSNLFLRFDKQQAFLGELRFSTTDPIHFKLHFRNKTRNEIIAICREAGLLS